MTLEDVEIRVIQPHEAPRELLLLKPSIDLVAYYEWARPGVQTGVFGLLATHEGRDVALLLAAWNPIYHGLVTDTLVIHPDFRGAANLAWLVRIFAQTLADVGKRMGARYVGMPTSHPRAMQRILRGLGTRYSETVIRLDLEGG